MTGQTRAIVHWRALDREGDDKCRLARADHGWLLVGHARFRDAADFAALDYVVRCDADWHTFSADIAGLHGQRDVSLHLCRDQGIWRVNDTPQPGLDDAVDLGIAFTPATHLMPVKRLQALDGVGIASRAAWLDYPARTLRPLDQVYSRTRAANVISYRARQTGHETQLSLDSSGFVTLFPGLWDGEVIHAAG